MIYNFSYRDNEIIRLINKAVGEPFATIDRFKLRGIGSPRFILETASEAIKKRIPKDYSTFTFSIELRPKGVIVHFKKYTEHYTWVIPYYRLSVYYSTQLSIHGEGEYMKINTRTLKGRHQKFLRKLMELKTSYAKQFANVG